EAQVRFDELLLRRPGAVLRRADRPHDALERRRGHPDAPLEIADLLADRLGRLVDDRGEAAAQRAQALGGATQLLDEALDLPAAELEPAHGAHDALVEAAEPLCDLRRRLAPPARAHLALIRFALRDRAPQPGELGQEATTLAGVVFDHHALLVGLVAHEVAD